MLESLSSDGSILAAIDNGCGRSHLICSNVQTNQILVIHELDAQAIHVEFSPTATPVLFVQTLDTVYIYDTKLLCVTLSRKIAGTVTWRGSTLLDTNTGQEIIAII